MKNLDYISYKEFAGYLGIRPGDVIWLAADLTRLAFAAKRHEGEFDLKLFIDGFQKQLGNEGTLIISAFNFNLVSGDHYSRSKTIPITGALATGALLHGDFIRTAHPLHSFLVWGKEAIALSDLNNKSSFGKGSPFEFLHNYHGKMVIIGTSISNAFTFVHYVEETEQVKYRKYQKINIYIEDENGWMEYLIYSKKPGWTMVMNGLEKLLLEKQVAARYEINGIPCSNIDLYSSFPVISDDIHKNKARNISCFTLKLYLRDLLKPVFAKAGYRTKSDKISHAAGLL